MKHVSRRIPLNTLIDQEIRATSMFLILLLTVVFVSDLITNVFLMNGTGLGYLLLPYVFLYLLIPLAIKFIKDKKPRYIKYMFFSTFITISIVVEIFMFWGSAD